uniref:Uncharacterized protein n=1 Tax=Phlebotomus papatasi TaxID=29031 RepID=A0A1B0D8I2_PHLPP
MQIHAFYTIRTTRQTSLDIQPERLQRLAVFYVAGQLLGGFIGFGVLKLITPKHIWRPEDATGPGVCTTVPHPDLSPFTAVTVEFIITSVLIFLCCGVWDSRNAKHHDSVPLRFGLTITGLALAGARFSGGSMNPARSLGPAIWNGDFEHHWIYWVGPLLAPLVVTPFYRIVFQQREAEPEETTEKRTEEFPLRTNNV